MPEKLLSIEKLWKIVDFHPNDNQKEAILHINGPLYLPAGPGSGKTRVLLWRTLNLIVFHDTLCDYNDGSPAHFVNRHYGDALVVGTLPILL